MNLLLPGPSNCGDGRTEVLHWEADGTIWLNEKRIDGKDVSDRVSEVFASRAEKVLFVIPDQSTSIQELAGVMSKLDRSVDDLHIGVVTHRQIEQMARTEYGMTFVPVGCMTWPASAFKEIR